MKTLCLLLVLCLFVAIIREADCFPGSFLFVTPIVGMISNEDVLCFIGALGLYNNRGMYRIARQRERAAFRAGKRVGMSIGRRRGRPLLRIG
ncbi:hypothetical protein M514_07630, partial [Trichuris suis]